MNKKETKGFSFLRHMTSGGEGILDIPHPIILRYKSPHELIKEFENIWGEPPTGVVLPIVVPDGLLWDEDELDLPKSRILRKVYDQFEFGKMVEEFSNQVKDIYFSINPTLGFVTFDSLHIMDSSSSASSQICIGNHRAQELIGLVIGLGIRRLRENPKAKSKFAGVVIDCTDLWPMGAENSRLELTCFCESCKRFFNAVSPGLLHKFDTFPNPWNLALADNQTGIGYIDDIPPGITAELLIGRSRKKGYLDIFGETSDGKLLDYAQDLLKYIDVRHKQTIVALHAIFDEAFIELDPSKKLKRIIVTEGVHYDWTSGLQLKRLDHKPSKGKVNPFDEVWFNSTSSELFFEDVKFRSYMWRRSRYFINAFFNTVSTASDPIRRTTTSIARLPEDSVRDLLRRRLSSAVSTADTLKSSLAALPNLEGSDKNSGSKRQGFVSVILPKELEKFIAVVDIPESGAEVTMSKLISVLRGGLGDDEK